MNKYAALCTAALVILSSAAIAGADVDGEAVESFEANGETYYVHETGIYQESNALDGLQLEGGHTSHNGEHVKYQPDERVSPALAP